MKHTYKTAPLYHNGFYRRAIISKIRFLGRTVYFTPEYLIPFPFRRFLPNSGTGITGIFSTCVWSLLFTLPSCAILILTRLSLFRVYKYCSANYVLRHSFDTSRAPVAKQNNAFIEIKYKTKVKKTPLLQLIHFFNFTSIC